MKEKGPYKVLSSKEIYKNPWILVREDKVIYPGGKEGIFGIIEMTHGISVLPVNSEKEVFLIKEYRYGAEKEVLGLIGGTVENSDTELSTAKRELKEETGLEAKKWVKLGNFNAYENVVKSKKLPLYLALDLIQGEQSLDENEILSVFKYPLSEAIEMVLNNSINSEISALAILMAEKYFENNTFD